MLPTTPPPTLERQRSYADLREFFNFDRRDVQTRVKTARVATETLQVPVKRQKLDRDSWK